MRRLVLPAGNQRSRFISSGIESARMSPQLSRETLQKMSPKELRKFIDDNLSGKVSKAIGGKGGRKKYDVVNDILAASRRGRTNVGAQSAGMVPVGGKAMRVPYPANVRGVGSEVATANAKTLVEVTRRLQQQIGGSKAASRFPPGHQDCWASRLPNQPQTPSIGSNKVAATASRRPVEARLQREGGHAATGWVATAVIGGVTVAAVANVPLATPAEESNADQSESIGATRSSDASLDSAELTTWEDEWQTATKNLTTAASYAPDWYMEAKQELNFLDAKAPISRNSRSQP